MNQSKKGASLPTTRLSPLAKPFTINRSTHHQQPSSNLSLLSTQEPSLNSIDHSNDDPFSSLLDSFRKSNLGSKGDSSVSVPLDNNYGFGKDTVKTTLPVETATQTQEKSLFEQNPSLEFHKNADFGFDGFRWSHFDIVEEVSLPTCSTNVTGLGYGNEVSYGKQQGVDFHGSVVGKGNDVGGSVDDRSMLQPGKHGVDGLNPCLPAPDGIFKKSTGTIGGKDILSNSIGTTHATDESSSFSMSNCKVAPLKISTSNMSSAKNTPQIQTSENSGDSDSDVDSPCWKGTVTFCPTPTENSASVKFHHVEKATEKHNSLNPLAPQFFPGIGIIKDGFVPSNSSAAVATNSLSGVDILMRKENDKEIELQHSSSNIYGNEKAFNMLNDKKCGSVDPVLNSYCMMTQSSSKDDCSTSKGKLATIVDVDDFVKGTKVPKASGSISGVFPSKVHSSTTTSTISSSQVDDVNDPFKTLQEVLKSLVNSPKPDYQTMVSAMHVISELLVQTCVDRVYSSNEHDRDMVQQIINNLNILSTKICDQRIPTSVATCADSAYFLGQSLELPKRLEVTSMKTLAVPQEHYLQNNYMQKNSVSEVLSQSREYSFASSSSQCTEKGNEIAQFQFIRKSIGKTLDFEKQMHPEALLFRNLWLDSEAELCYRRYKTYCCLMEAGMDVNCTNVAELWR